MKHRILAGTLTVLLLLGVTSTAAFAAEYAPVIAPTPVIAPAPVIAPIAPNPASEVTRAQVVSYLWELSGKPVVNYAMQFDDVTADTDSAEAIRWAAAEKIANGYGNNKFGPTDAVTREQLATIVYNYVKKFGMGFTGSWMFLMPYADRADVREWAFEPVMWMVANKLFGSEMEQLQPQQAVNQAEATEFFESLATLAQDKNVDFSQYGEVKK